MRYFSNPKKGFDNYWFKSAGKPTALVSYLKKNRLWSGICAERENAVIPKSDLLASHNLEDLDPDSMLMQMGYLSIKSIDGQRVILDHPNVEVRQSFSLLYTDLFLGDNKIYEFKSEEIKDPLSKGSADEVMAFLNRLMTSADYNDVHQISNEAICRFCIQICLSANGIHPRTEVHNAFGRSDLELDVGQYRWVFEFKFAAQRKNAPALLKEAEAQIVSRHYGESNLSKRKLIRIGLVYSKEDRCFTHWSVVP